MLVIKNVKEHNSVCYSHISLMAGISGGTRTYFDVDFVNVNISSKNLKQQLTGLKNIGVPTAFAPTCFRERLHPPESVRMIEVKQMCYWGKQKSESCN